MDHVSTFQCSYIVKYILLCAFIYWNCLVPQLDPTYQNEVDVNMSNTTTNCSVMCGAGHLTTTTVTCKGKSKGASNYRIDDSMKCWTNVTRASCNGISSSCPGIYKPFLLLPKVISYHYFRNEILYNWLKSY